MCGIAGLIGSFESDKLNTVIKTMTEKMVHRGPDAEGYYIKPGVAFGHRRLSIIDLSSKANQPFIDPSGRFVLIFNGEIYNYREIKAQITDFNFITNSDTEVILAAFCKWGTKCLDLLNGMFTIAIWDNQEQRLFIARDRLGVKPLYYYHDDNLFLFASEIRALMSSGLFAKEISVDSLDDYLKNEAITAPFTLFKNVYQLMPGQYGVYQKGTFNLHEYWNIAAKRSSPNLENPEQIKKEVRRLLTESVERRMVSDVEVGAFLSGGIDSSAIVALMAEVTDQTINTFSVVFDEIEYDESQFSNLIAKRYNTNHIRIDLKSNYFLDELPAALAAMDSPSGDGINSYIVSKATKNAGFTVALSGVGGDELFAGYQHFKLFYKIKNNLFLNSSPYFLRRFTGNISNLLRKGIKGDRFNSMTQLKEFNIENLYPLLKQVFSDQSVNKILINGNKCNNRVFDMLLSKSADIHRLPILSQYSVAELLGYTQNVLLRDMDQMSMANSLEVREPFFDFKLIEYVLQIPDNFKYPHHPKGLLVDSLAELLPPEIALRKKMGFTFPWEHWLKKELKDFVETKLKSLGQREQFSSVGIGSLWLEFLTGKNDVRWIHIWQLVVLENYLSNNVD